MITEIIAFTLSLIALILSAVSLIMNIIFWLNDRNGGKRK